LRDADKSVLANAWTSSFRPLLAFSKNFLFRKNHSTPSHENSNNPLAVEPESENDVRRWNFNCEFFDAAEAAAS